MRHFRILSAVFFVFLTIAGQGVGQGKKTPQPLFENVQDLKGLDDARAAAKKSGKHILLLFYRTNCPWCKRFERDTLSVAKIKKLLTANTIRLKIDRAANRNLVMELTEKPVRKEDRISKIVAAPTLVRLNSEGKEVGRILGFHPPRRFARLISKWTQTKK